MTSIATSRVVAPVGRGRVGNRARRARAPRAAVTNAARGRDAAAAATTTSSSAINAVRGDVATSAVNRREATLATAATMAALFAPEPALATPPRQTMQVPESDYKPIPGTNPPIMYADVKGGSGSEGGVKPGQARPILHWFPYDRDARPRRLSTPTDAFQLYPDIIARMERPGQRVAVHFDVKFRRLTIATSRQGAGVTGGTPYGFTVGTPAGTPGGPFIKALNEGIKGMGPGQFRRLIVPPEYAYGNQQVQEIPPNATLTIDLELLSIAARA